jgi:VanZ family protein
MTAIRRTLALASRWYAVAFMLAVIFGLSSLPNLAEPHRQAIPFDKVAHFSEYTTLGFVLAGSLRRQAGARLPLLLLLLAAAALGALYGATDEFHQRFVPGRDPDIHDWLADLTGSTIGALLSAALLPSRLLRRASPPG